jgi:hypothetical protein
MIMAMAMPLQFYSIKIFGLNWTLDRFILVLMIPTIFLFFYVNNFKVKPYIYFVLIWLLIITFNLFLFHQTIGAVIYKKIQGYYLSSFVLLLSVTVMRHKLKIILSKILITHAIIIVFFGFYSIYHLWILNEISFTPPLLTEATWLNSGNEHMKGLMAYKRLTFPFGTSPLLSYISGFLIIYGIYKLYNRRGIIWYFLLPSLFIILLGTFSRSGLLSLIISIISLAIYNRNKSARFNSKPIYVFLIIIFIILPFSIVGISRVFDIPLLMRMTDYDIFSDGSSFAGHINIRLIILKKILFSNPVNIFFGYGIGGTVKYLNVSSGHMSFATVLYDLGIIGLVFFSILWFYPAFILFKKKGKTHYPKILFIFAFSIFIIFCHMFYDATTFVPFWLYLGWVVNNVFEANKNRVLGET